MRTHRLPTLAVALATTAVLGLGLAGCGDDADADTATGSDSSVCPDGTVTFGVEPFEDPAKLTPAYQAIADGLGDELGCDVELQVVDTYAAEVLAMKNGKLDIGQFGPLGYVFANREAGAQAIASFGTGDGELSSYTAGIWVPKDSDITSIDDLSGHSLALSEPGSTSGDALPRQALADAGISESDLQLDYAGGHPESLLALTHGKVDAAEINSQQLATSTEAGQFDEADYTQIWTSDPIPNDPITVSSAASPELQAAIKKALLHLPAEAIAQAAAFLDVEPAGQLVAVTQEDYQPLFDLADTLGLTEDDV
jgi:phosphonate transport system substrate-binding protein